MNIFDDKKFEEIQFAKSWFQINFSKFYQLSCMFNAIKRNWISFHSLNGKERSVKLQVVEIFRSQKDMN